MDANGGPAVLVASFYDKGVEAQSALDVGVDGFSDQQTGVSGHSNGSFGVMGLTTSDDSIAVIGAATNDSGGVWGQTGGTNWPGVGGSSGGGVGVRGVSVAPAGNNIGVLGYSQDGYGVAGYTSSPSMAGAIFLGGLIVEGKKSSAVRHPDGSHRLLYCMDARVLRGVKGFPQCADVRGALGS